MVKKIVTFLFYLILFPPTSDATVLFSDDYDSPGDTGWTCADAVRDGYTGLASCDEDTYGGVTHHAGEITSGGRSGNSLKLWRRNGIWNETAYMGYLNKILSEAEFANHYRELYFRWYVKINPNWDASMASTHKLNRMTTSTTAGGTVTSEIYFDVKGTSFKNGEFSIYPTKGGGIFYTSKSVSELGVNDGEWHSLELHIKLNSDTGVADGEVHFYVNGVSESLYIPFFETWPTGVTGWGFGTSGYSDDEYFRDFLTPAIGNLTDGDWDFPTSGWYAFEFDDFVVSTEYIGPDEAPSPSISAPSGLRVVGGWSWK